MEDLFMRDIQRIAAELHVMCATDGRAAEAFGKMAARLDKEKLQQLQVVLSCSGGRCFSGEG